MKVYMAKKKMKVRNDSYAYISSVLLNTSYEHIINCIAKNSFWSKKGSYEYEFNNSKTEGNFNILCISWNYINLTVYVDSKRLPDAVGWCFDADKPIVINN